VRRRQKNARPCGRAFWRAVQGRALGAGLVIVTAVAIAVVVTIMIAVVLHVIHGATVAFFKALAEFAPIMFVDGRVLVHLMIVGVGVTAIHVIPASGFNTFTEALPLRISVSVWSAIPVAITILILALGLGSAVLRIAWVLLLGGSLDGCRGGHA
jgi:hypothetical protein